MMWGHRDARHLHPKPSWAHPGGPVGREDIVSRQFVAPVWALAGLLVWPADASAVDAVTKASPASVPADTAQRILWITGNGFAPGDQVAISGDGITEIAAPVVVPEAMRMDGGRGDGIRYTIGVAAGASSGRRDITVTGFDGTSATGAGLLEITGGGVAPPTQPPTAPPTGASPDMGNMPGTEPALPSGVDVVTRASPTAGAQGEQVNLWVVGRTFTDGVTVTFSAPGMGPALVDGLPLPLSVVRNAPSEEKLDGIQFFLRISPDTPVGPVDITVTGPDGTSATGAGVFNVLRPGDLPPPVAGAGNADTIAGASPPGFRAGRNISLWIWGRDFEPGAQVIFSNPGIHPYSDFEVVNEAGNYDGADGIRAFLLVNADVPPGPIDVTVRNPNLSQVTRQGLVQVVGDDGAGAGGAGGGGGLPVEPCLPDTTSIADIVAVQPVEALRNSPLPLTIIGHGFACGATVVISGGGLRAPQGSAPRILRDAVDPTLTTLQWDLEVDEAARFGPRDVTVVNPNNSSKTLPGAFEIVETLSGDGGVDEKGASISACAFVPGSRTSAPLWLAGLLLLGRRRRR
jgi:hypothetical protein